MNWIKTNALILMLSPVMGLQAADFDEAIKKATTSGQFRLGYISVTPDVAGAKTTTATAFGGHVKFETAEWNHFQFALAPYFTERLDVLSGDKSKSTLNADFFNASSESFAYLGEAYANYAWSHGSARFGRQQIDTPFINTDDIRLLPNTFNAAWFNLTLGKSVTLDAGVVSRWAGFDSGSKDKFVKAKTDGVSAVGINYKASDAVSAQGWFYDFAKQYSLLYADVTYAKGALEIGGQYASYSEKNASNVAGSVIGLKAAYTLGAFNISAAMNRGTNAAGKSADLGLGGGNFYTSMDESTIGGLTEASAQHLALSYAATEKFSITLAHGHFEDKGKATTNNNETFLVLNYSVSDHLNMDFTHATLDNKANQADTATNFSRQIFHVNYLF